jgi:cysteine desulfuration protein SufE
MATSLEQRIAAIEAEFQGFSDWESRYKHLIELGKMLPAMNEANKLPHNLVKGCQSQVWLFAEINEADSCLEFEADSDASIVKGIVALLVKVYNGASPEEILAAKPDFLDKIGLKQHLSMNRANGLSHMVKQIQFYAMAYQAKMNAAKLAKG